jgi:alpha-galactosidase
VSAKIAMIGAGSVVFCKTLMSDILATPALAGCEFALMSPTEAKLRRMEAFGRRMLRDNGLPGSVWATTDRREAIAGADFVVVMIQVGGFDAYGVGLRNPAPVRRGPVHRGHARAGGHLPRPAPHPGAGRDRAGHAGGRQARRPDAPVRQPDGRQLPRARAGQRRCPVRRPVPRRPDDPRPDRRVLRGPKDEISFTCGGINHMDWFLTLEHKPTGRDLYPELRERFERPEYYKNERCGARCSATSATS